MRAEPRRACPRSTRLHTAASRDARAGKSAILAALQICLGARAKTTHRGNNMGDLVRHGFDGQALVRVGVANRGSDGYKHEIFGDVIYIERRFGRTGAGSFKMLDENKSTVTSEKKEVFLMLDKMNIQVDNPVAVLDQENSKNFIRGSEKQKFQFFQRATDLEKIILDIKECQANIEIAAESARFQHGQLESFATTYENAKKEYDELQKTLRLSEQIKELKVNLMWAYVDEAEEDVTAKTGTFDAQKKRSDALQAKYDKLNADAERQVDDSEISNELDRLNAEMGEIEKRLKDVKTEKARAKEPIKRKQNQIKSVQQEAKTAKNEKAAVQKSIDDARAEEMRDSSKEIRERMEKMQRVEEERERIAQRNRSIDEECHAAQQEAQSQNTAAQHAKRDLQTAQGSIAELEKHITNLRSSSNSPLKQYGQKMPELFSRIEAQRSQFKGQVVGPIGQHVKLRDDSAKRWLKAIDVVIANRLGTFVLSDSRDREIVRRTMDSVGIPSREQRLIVLPGSQGRYRIARDKRPSEEFTTVDDVLQVDHDLAYNALVDFCGIDTTVLFKDRYEAERAKCIEEHGDRKWKFARGVAQVMFENGSKETIARSGYRSNTPRQSTKPVISLGRDASELVQSAELELSQARPELDRYRRAYDDCNNRATTAQHALQQLKNEADKSSRRDRKLEQELEALRQEQQQADDNKMDTSEWEEQVERFREDIEGHEATIGRLQNEVRTLEENLPALEQQEQEFKANSERLRAETEAKEQELSQSVEQQEGLKKKAAIAKQKLDAENKHLPALEKAVEAARADFDKTMGKAQEYTRSNREGWDGERPHIGKTGEAIKQLIKKTADRYDREIGRRDVRERDPEVRSSRKGVATGERPAHTWARALT